MDLKQLQQFVVLAETLNFRRAADRLHIAQPALSVSIRRLEEDLGVRLFERGRRGATLTSGGIAALPEAYQALEHAARMREQASAGSDGEVGTVRLCFVGTVTYELLPRALTESRARHPKMKVELHELTNTAIAAGLSQGTFDIGIVRYPMTAPAGMVMDIVEEDTFWIALPTGHRLARRKRVALADFADDPFVFPSAVQMPALCGISMAACQAAGFFPRIAQEAIQLQTVISLVQCGMGVALIPSSVAKLIHRRVEFRPLSDVANASPIGLALLYPALRLSRFAQHFRDVVLDVSKDGRKRRKALATR